MKRRPLCASWQLACASAPHDCFMPRKPTESELKAARHKKVPDILAPNLHVLFCGINPGIYSAAVGHHFARPGNRFWPALHASGFTDRLFTPDEDRDLLRLGYGLTNIVARTTASAKELANDELVDGGLRLTRKVVKYQPRVLAILGVSAYRTAFYQPHAALGEQPERCGDTRLWVLPNPSGLNAHYTLSKLAAQFHELLAFITNQH
jgi:double-stranded uracil-DNA glycosylase